MPPAVRCNTRTNNCSVNRIARFDILTRLASPINRFYSSFVLTEIMDYYKPNSTLDYNSTNV